MCYPRNKNKDTDNWMADSKVLNLHPRERNNITVKMTQDSSSFQPHVSGLQVRYIPIYCESSCLFEPAKESNVEDPETWSTNANSPRS